ncbi:MAG: DUF924 domain-containing protein [Rhodospirillales bacterium]|nr:DUF924 domain-containing protein [Rhodospirillales bacterium]
MTPRARAVLDFWFGPPPFRPRRVWFERDPAFDEACDAFVADQAQAAAGAYRDWATTPEGALALVLLLDQFPRNLYRGTARAYASDALALETARRAVEAGWDRLVSPVQRLFFYLPFEHSESLADQDEACRLVAAMTDHPEHAELVRYAERHREIVARFGRFPHRNAALGRATTPEEAAFLEEPGSSF